MTHQTVDNYLEEKESTQQVYLEKIVIKVCLLRLLLIVILLFPITIINSNEFSLTRNIYLLFSQKQLLIFTASALIITLLFIVSWRFFKDVLIFFRLQLITDILFSIYFMIITGGISSNGSFVLLAILFLYSRILGNKTSFYSFLSIIFILLIITIVQVKSPHILNLKKLNIQMACYYFSLQLLALSLIMLLIKMSQTRENVLLEEITRQRQAIINANAIKTKVFDWINSGIIVLDKHGLVKSINKKGSELLDIPPIDTLSKPLKEVFPPFYNIWKECRIDVQRHEIQHQSKVYGITLSTIPEDSGTLIIFSDITRIKELEKKITQMEKMAVIGELAAGLAHEIKNPLSGIKASLQLLNNQTTTEVQKKRLREIIFRDITRLDNLLKDFLYFARPKDPERKEIRLLPLINSILLGLKSTHPDVKFILTPSLKDQVIYWDEDQLKQVLLNLLLNSIQAMKNNKTKKVVIGFGRDKKKREMIFIQDLGHGLDLEDTKNIFDPFFTTKSEGTGLGLSIAQRLASQNNSWIEIKNRKTKGCIAKLYLNQS